MARTAAEKEDQPMAPASLEGQTLGKYRVLEALGRGGMAQVYRAYHPQLDRYVAIKVLRSDLVEEQEFLTRFRREARAVARLRHPHIVQVFDFDVQGDTYFMVMELLEGDTLKARQNDYRARGQHMPLGEMVRVLLDVLDGLAYAHGEGMIHRDIKPANIMLTRRGQAVITDFGIARIVGGTQHTAAGALMGTLNYISPEQGLEGKSDARSDIYSLGIVFYEMLTGCPPFDADTPLAILLKHLHDPLPLPRATDPTIPEPFERIVLKALAKRPEDRFQTAAEMAQALHEAAAQAGVELPESISLPLSFTTAEAPQEPVAVLSGSAREQVSEAEFARDETDPSLARRLAEEQAALAAAPAGAAAPGAAPAAPATPAAQAAKPARPFTVGRAVLSMFGLLAGWNVLASWLGIITGLWSVYGRGWPTEVLLAGLGLALVMYASSSMPMLIPVGIVLGNGLLLSYYALTNLWYQWAFLWPLEPLLVIGSVLVMVRLQGRSQDARSLARDLGRKLALLAAGASAFVAIVSLLLGFWMR
jgi:serine/threonine protein kinase